MSHALLLTAVCVPSALRAAARSAGSSAGSGLQGASPRPPRGRWPCAAGPAPRARRSQRPPRPLERSPCARTGASAEPRLRTNVWTVQSQSHASCGARLVATTDVPCPFPLAAMLRTCAHVRSTCTPHPPRSPTRLWKTVARGCVSQRATPRYICVRARRATPLPIPPQMPQRANTRAHTWAPTHTRRHRGRLHTALPLAHRGVASLSAPPSSHQAGGWVDSTAAPESPHPTAAPSSRLHAPQRVCQSRLASHRLPATSDSDSWPLTVGQSPLASRHWSVAIGQSPLASRNWQAP